jgi:hypothetical protein
LTINEPECTSLKTKTPFFAVAKNLKANVGWVIRYPRVSKTPMAFNASNGEQ